MNWKVPAFDGRVGRQRGQGHFIGIAVEVQNLRLLDQLRALVHPEERLHKLRRRIFGVEPEHGQSVVVRLGLDGEILVEAALAGDDLNDGAGVVDHFRRILVGQLLVGQVVPYILVRDD